MFYIDTVDKRNGVLFELLQKEGKQVQKFDLAHNKYNNDDIIVFAPSKKLDIDFVNTLPNNITLFGGAYSLEVQNEFKSKNIKYINLLQNETFAIKNANLTCEGVLALIIQNSDKSIYENNVLILGAGRIAKGMAILFSKLGVSFAIASFNEEKFPQNFLYSKKAYLGYDFVKDLHNFDIIINTIPAKIIDDKIIKKIAPKTLFIETASIDCLDKNLAQHFTFLPAPALPQKFSCYTAGKLMKENIEYALHKLKNKN